MIAQKFYSILLYPILFCPSLSDPLEITYILFGLGNVFSGQDGEQGWMSGSIGFCYSKMLFLVTSEGCMKLECT